MIASRDRILTTHAGSLPQSETLSDHLSRPEAGEATDSAQLAHLLDNAVAHVIDQQVAAGIDIGNDGAQQRADIVTDLARRMTGFGRESNTENTPRAIADVDYVGTEQIQSEIGRLQHFANGKFFETFMTAPSPGIIAATISNAYYDSDDAYLTTLARALAKKYRAIIDAGPILQIDAPDLAANRTVLFQDKSDAEFTKIRESFIGAINQAIEGLPRDRIRLHCGLNGWMGSDHHDIRFDRHLPVLLQAKVGAIGLTLTETQGAQIEAVPNVTPIAHDMILIPDVVDLASDRVEDPERIADRICAAVDAIGDRERVIASAGYSFATSAERRNRTASAILRKLTSLREGADIATERLWGTIAA